MNNFKRNNRTPDWNKGGGFGEKKTMFRASCARCQRSCEVPFKPNGSKPVFCSDCFVRDEDSGPKRFGGRDSGRMNFDRQGSSDRFERRDSGRSRFEEKTMFRTKCDQCNDPCEVPFKPSGEKPVYCQDCFGHGGDARVKHTGGSNKNTDQLSEQLKAMNNKLDSILNFMKASAVPAVVHTVSLEEKKASKEKTDEAKPKKSKLNAVAEAVEQQNETKPKKKAAKKDDKKEAKPKKKAAKK